ncbi:FTR1 family protein [Corynebacterium bovis]|uniref:iron uptake transporter permease EfeU n=1 Tax=Corynebacterium bovis TaxID=36808 RepID=UPI00244BAB59|nr:iron uptake transporter permease EfeU [Corynebacterium bovis]MDH2455233.1 FTR1 family protein [Corynebacterium bovis]
MFYANALIGVREGLEATMVVIILAAYLTKTRQRRSLPWLWSGIVAALAVTVAVFLLIHYGTKTLTTTGQEIIGGVASLVTVALVSWMLLWMKGTGASIARELEGRLGDAVAVGPLAVALVAFIAVAREGIETALLVFDSFTSSFGVPFAGLATGVVISVIIGVLMYAGAIRVNLGLFFRVTGLLLIVVAAGILRYGVTDLQEANILPGLQTHAFDLSAVIRPGTWYATILEGMFNIIPQPTVLAFIAWLVYLVVALPLFLRPARTRSSSTPSPDRPAEAATEAGTGTDADAPTGTRAGNPAAPA